MANTQYPEEEQHLRETVEFIDGEIQRLKVPPWAAHNVTAKILKEMNDEKRARYQMIRPRPYFGRIDFLPEDGEKPIEAYVGIWPVGGYDGKYVFDWTAPFPGELFFADPRRVAGYTAPRGEIRGRITLKRQYAIQGAQLQDVTEVYRSLPSPDDNESGDDLSEGFMAKQLSHSRGGQLREVVATIQPDQYQQIAGATGQVMLVQGVAGSGKSIVGLHRIAYLVSPFNQRPERITASRVVFFGPTRMFIKYVSNLLPSLDVSQVTQTTVKDWLRSTLSERVYRDRREPLIEKLLKLKGDRWQAAYQAARLKGSLEMARTLERHVETLRKGFVKSSTALAVRMESPTPIILDAARTRRIVRETPTGPINAQRDRVINRLAEALWEVYAHPMTMPGARTPRSTRRDFLERGRPQVEQQVATFWPKLDFRQEYRRLICEAESLEAASRGRMGGQESGMLAASLPRRPYVFQPEDLGALCYLDHLLNDRPNSRFEHVVLDEAQEVSPLELQVVRIHSRDNGFTILGDLTQSLSPQGVERWHEALRLFKEATVSRYVARTSFRATYEITRYANRILKKAVPNGATAIPYKRRGEPPSFNQAKSYKEMVVAIAADIRDLEMNGAQTIGVLCKTSFDARKLRRALSEAGIMNAGVLDSEESLSGSAVVAPIHLTRALNSTPSSWRALVKSTIRLHLFTASCSI